MKRVSSDQPYELLGKALFAGNSSVGKTSLIYRMSDNAFKSNNMPTIGVEFASVRFRSDEDDAGVKIQIWDCAGQERFQSIVNSYFRQANAIFFVFDITNYPSFDELRGWVSRAENTMGDNPYVKVIVGNKSDLGMVRAVPEDVASKFAKEHDAMYFEVSAKDPIAGDIVIGFEKVVDTLYRRYVDGEKILVESDLHKMRDGTVTLNGLNEDSPERQMRCADCF